MTHPDAELARRVFGAFRRDPRRVAEAIDENAVWTVVGRAPVAGVYRGRRAIRKNSDPTPASTASTVKPAR